MRGVVFSDHGRKLADESGREDEFMRTVDESEAKMRFSSLLEEVERGEGIAITRHGRIIARLVPVEQIDPERVDAAIAKLKELRVGSSLGGLSWKELRDEGRR